jgi:hypothetical protein
MDREPKQIQRTYESALDCYDALVDLLFVLQLNVSMNDPIWQDALANAKAVIERVEGI